MGQPRDKKGRFAKKAKANGIEHKGYWSSVNAGAFGGTYDYFGGQREPGKFDLVKAYDDIVYACVSMIASNIAYCNIRLYVKTGTGQRQPKCATAPVAQKNIKRIVNRYAGTDVREVIEHPLLDLLNRANPYHNRSDLLETTETYLDLTGNAYWLLNFDEDLGIPDGVFPLPAQNVTPERDQNGYVREWVLNQGIQEKRYKLNQIIHFKFNNPLDPYGEGYSPLRAAWSRHQISAKELSYLDNYLSNQGRPDAILSIKDSVDPGEAQRLAKEYYHRYQGQGNGGVIVADGTMNLQPLNFPARDYAELQVYQVLKTVICNCFRIPPDIFEQGNASSYASRDAALASLARDCLTPRIRNIVEELNTRLVPYFDDRFFFEADAIVEEDKQHELAVDQMLLTQQVVTRDEVRQKYGWTSAEWAKEPLLPSGVMPVTMFNQTTEQAPEPEPTEPEAKDRTAQAAAVQQLQQAVYAGQLPRPAALANAVLIFGFSKEEAEALIPEAAPAPAQPPEGEKLGEQETATKPETEPEPEQPEAKAITTKAMRQLAPGPLVKALQGFFAKLAREVGGKVKALDEAQTKSLSVLDWFDVDAWTEAMSGEMRPIISAFYDHAAQETVKTLSLAGSFFSTVQPKLKEGVDKATLAFCRETLDTTAKDLDQARDLLKKEMTEGLEVGDVKNAMAQRVQKVFEDATNDRAFMIGVTEASRGQHNAMILTAKESGVVAGKTWLLSDDACPLCKPLSGKTVGLDDAFMKDGTGPYAEITAPPRHPHCRCTLLLKVD